MSQNEALENILKSCNLVPKCEALKVTKHNFVLYMLQSSSLGGVIKYIKKEYQKESYKLSKSELEVFRDYAFELWERLVEGEGATNQKIVVAGRYRRTPKDFGYFRIDVWG